MLCWLRKGQLDGSDIIVAVQDFAFMGGSLGSDAGGAIVAGMLKAVKDKTPFVLFVASGGARMQEGIFSLMQMPRTTVALQRLREAGLPYIVVLTDPTMGGVTASYAMLGDIHIAEPGALIGFAGPRVIEQTIREQLPSGFQRSEFLLEHGMVDLVVHRHELRATLGRLCALLMKQPVREEMAISARRTRNDAMSTLTCWKSFVRRKSPRRSKHPPKRPRLKRNLPQNQKGQVLGSQSRIKKRGLANRRA